MGMTTPPFLTLCLLYLSGPIANFGWAIPSMGDQLKEMTAAIQPSFSKGLVDLSNLFDLVMNNDGKIGNLNGNNNTMLPIQRAIQSASNWLNKTEAISNYHMQMYDAGLLSLSPHIYTKDSHLQRYTMELQTLTNEMTEWKTKSAVLRQEIIDHDAQAARAESFVKSLESRLNEGIQRAVSILLTIFTAGIYLGGLIASELELAEAKRQIEKWRNEGERARELIQIAINNLHDGETRQRATEESIKKRRTILLSVQTRRELLRSRYATLRGLGVQIRNICTFTSLLNGELIVLHGQHHLLFFRPLLKSIDSLVNFLEDNANILVLIADTDAVSKIRRHFSKNVVARIGN